ncbi:MAG: SDR family oxidoreductase [Nitrospinota bacterium]|nr:SDR family oxidoreductase [Nitrospinota bacterium]
MSKLVLITGAGTGIGRSISETLAKQGFSLILCGRNLDNLEQTKIKLKNPENHSAHTCDVRKISDVKSVLQNNNTKSLYGLVANAGIGGENTYGEKDRWHEIIETNLTGTYQTLQECLPYLKKDDAPFKKVVILSSILARLGVPGYSAYCASKAGLLGLTRSLAAEHSGNKILINAICPGWVNTDMAQKGIDGFADALKITKEQADQEAMKQVPLGKMSEPEEIADFISYLFSEQQTSLTGQTIDINNGALMH